MSEGRWVWAKLEKGSWDLWWVLFGTWTANPHFLETLWQGQTQGGRACGVK